jgi:hypothetical protein
MVMQQLYEPAELEAIIPDTVNDATVTASSSRIPTPTPELGEIY